MEVVYQREKNKIKNEIHDDILIALEEQLKDDVDNDMIVYYVCNSLLNKNIVFTSDYFSTIYTRLSYLSDKCSYNLDDIRFKLLYDLKQVFVYKQSETTVFSSIGSILNLILYPLQKVKFQNLKNKKYDNYNIDIAFFTALHDMDILSENTNNITTVYSFKFNRRNVLKSFVLHKPFFNIKYHYNDKYVLTKMEFSDGKFMDVNI